MEDFWANWAAMQINSLQKFKEQADKARSEIASRKKRGVKPVRTFSEYFLSSTPESLPQALKRAFTGDNKTTMAVLIHVLRYECEPKLLIVENGDFKEFHKTMVEYFSGQDIGTRQYYQNTSKALSGNKSRKNEIESSKERINAILQSIDNK